MRNQALLGGILLILSIPAMPYVPPAAAAPAPFTLAGDTTFTSSGSMAGRFVVDHNMTTSSWSDWNLTTAATNAILRIENPDAAVVWTKNRESNQPDGIDFRIPTFVPGTYFIYMGSTPPTPMTLTIRFANETGSVLNALDIPIQSWSGELQPTNLPDDGMGRIISKWTSTQPFSGNAFSTVHRHLLYKPNLYEYHEEYRWSLPEGVYNCFDFDGGATIGLGPSILDEGGDSYIQTNWMHHNGTATFDMFRQSVGVPTTWLVTMYWLQRLPDDLPWPDAPSWLGWAHPVGMPAGLGDLGYDALCASRNVPTELNTVSHLIGEHVGNGRQSAWHHIPVNHALALAQPPDTQSFPASLESHPPA